MLNKVPLRKIAAQYDTSTATVLRHQPHVTQSLVKVHEAKQLANATSVYNEVQRSHERINGLIATAESILQSSVEDNDKQGAIQAIKVIKDTMAELRSNLAFRDQLETRREQPQELPSHELKAALRSKLSTLFYAGDGVIDVVAQPIAPDA